MLPLPFAVLVVASTIWGTIVDARSGVPLANVIVVLEASDGTYTRASTAPDGAFAFEDVLSGTLHVEHPGYRRIELRVTSGEPLGLELVPIDEALEGFLVEGVRGGRPRGSSASTTLAPSDLERVYTGQEMPALLRETPSVTTYSDAGIPAGYSYMRLRGLDQTRISMTIDGAPLNEPEDQGVYFSNFPDFANSIRSIRVQRGVGLSAFGSAAYVGAVHLESVRLSELPRHAELQGSAGSYSTWRGSAEAATGTTARGLAAYGRVSGHRTDGYRRHSGSRSYSFFASAARFGESDQVKLTAFGGHSWNDMTYLAASASSLSADPRANPLADDEVDDFRQMFVSVDYTRQVTGRATWTVKGYRSDLTGKYDVRVAGLWNFALTSDWTGVVTYTGFQSPAWTVDVGAHVSWYRRDHRLRVRPDLSSDVYHNAGLRGEQSAFVRASRHVGPVSLLADAQLRRSTFEYVPDAAGVALTDLAWTFFNPRFGARFSPRDEVDLFAFYGRTSREPTRNDLFAGFDDIGSAEVAFIGDPPEVRPETVHDVELGAAYSGPFVALSGTLFWMSFRDEIAPIGRLSYIGLPLRKNVSRSFRRGVELDWRLGDPSTAWRAGGSATAMEARIDAFTDDATGVTYRAVTPLLTPVVVGSAWVERALTSTIRVGLDVRFAGPSYLGNDEDERFRTPAYTFGDAYTLVTLGHHETLVQLHNVTSRTVYTSGYHDGVESYFYRMAPRNVSVTVRMRL
jgi:iron complex outermembrane receptor protein